MTGRGGAIAALIACGCATIESGRYGVASLELQGVRQLDEGALRACLATEARPHFSFAFGRTPQPECGVPPFDSGRVDVRLWRWPWTDWPLYDRAVWQRDLQRIERWYRARGYYDARVLSVHMEPAAALESDRFDPHARPCDSGSDDEGCELAIRVNVHEGEPVRVRHVAVELCDRLAEDGCGPADPDAPPLPDDVVDALANALRLREGDRFDEALYDRSRRALADALAERGYARAFVSGRVRIDPATRSADVRLLVVPGPPCTFGEVRVTGHGELPARVIAAAALIEPGSRFRQSALAEAQRAIYGLGAFSSVEVVALVPDDPAASVVPVLVRVVPGRLSRLGFGAGIQVGTFDGQDAQEWDIHLTAVAEWRNLWGGLRALRLEERPRLAFPAVFPSTGPEPFSTSNLGNEIALEARQPGFFEPRTQLVLRADWDYGRDRAFDASVRLIRHRIRAAIGPERAFFGGRLFAAVRLVENVYLPVDTRQVPFDLKVPLAHDTMFLEQTITLDLRDDPRAPRRGLYASVTFQQGGYVFPSDWSYLRVVPDLRVYLPLPVLDAVFAARTSVGLMHVSSGMDLLGPSELQFRAGGASSNRGYLPGRVGDSPTGLRRWDASAELRVPVTESFGVVLFADAGDVSDGVPTPTDVEDARDSPDVPFRFDHPHLSLGFGLRYRTLVGPVRFDVGWRVPGAQFPGDARRGPHAHTEARLPGLRFDGAVHLTIGEAF
ncbi:MAG: BamA/TamA family outer membrane protein [Myxococcota bacterium]|nr:BamA/TamA family outer membrane protein [Myxococcota bacterium]MDW8363708.1 BamA/TamA family outer membrane protein [Myxococcales bacterium]